MRAVRVKIESSRPDGSGGADVIRTTATGRRRGRDTVYVRYKEPPESGLDNTCTLLKLKDGRLTLSRKGEVRQRLEFVAGRTTRCQYRTPLAAIDLTVTTETLKVARGSNSLSVYVEYQLALGGQPQGLTRLSIFVGEDAGFGH
jgi:uncharacterized beta-barrel protein YwiB (DUF1934 family)